MLVGSPLTPVSGSSKVGDTFFFNGAVASFSSAMFVADELTAYAPSIISGADSGTLNGTIW